MSLRRSLQVTAVALLCAGCEASIFGPGATSGSSWGSVTCGAQPARVRRLTRQELDATLSRASGSTVTLGQGLVPEDSRLGYFGHDGLLVSALFADQLDAALPALTQDQAAKASCTAGEAERACAGRILKSVAEKSWRRPTTPAEDDELLKLYDVGREGETFTVGLTLALQGVYQSTGTLYRTELGEGAGSGKVVTLTSWEIASELSYTTTGLPPDEQLEAAARSGSLAQMDVRVQHLKRLLTQPETTNHMTQFVVQWFGLTNMSKVQKNNLYFPKFSTTLRDAFAASATQHIYSVFSAGGSHVSDLLNSDYTYGDDSVAQFMGLSERPGTQMQRLSLGSVPRRGLLAHPAFLSVYAHNDDGSPVQRGKMVRTQLFCEPIPPPPPNVVAAVAPVSNQLTTRERVAAHSVNDSCASCHRVMDPIGFGLESFDGFGEFRTMESGKPIDDSGEIVGSDVAGTFRGPLELTSKLAQSEQVGACAVKQLARYTWGRHEVESDQCTIDSALLRYKENGTSIYAALEGLVSSDAFIIRKVP